MVEKKYLIDNKRLMSEWAWDKNNKEDISPDKYTLGSNKKVWWRGKCEHTWQASITERNRGSGCPYCQGRRLLSGYNDLLTKAPHIAREMDDEKNFPITALNIVANSHTTVWWKCEKGHNWKATPNHRVSKGRGCPYCAPNPKVLSGYNDFATIHPELISEWDVDKNEKANIFPDKITSNSNKKVWWKCKKGHEWKTSVNHRSNGSGCPYCSQALQTSFPEQAVFYYVKKYYPDAMNKCTEVFKKHRMELDIYIPSMSIGIEYDGVAYHRTEKQIGREKLKFSLCREQGITLIRMREGSEETSERADIIVPAENLQEGLLFLKKYLPRLRDLNVERDRFDIMSSFLSAQKENSLQALNSKLEQEWNYEKNGAVTPDMFSSHSNRKVWWKCERGHEWEAKIDERSRGHGCPYCANNKIMKGFNDLASRCPDLMEEWNFSKNSINPETITPGSGKKAWWRCKKCGNEWLAEISSRNKNHGCPVCGKTKSRSKRAEK